MKLDHIFLKLGFSENESQVYLAALASGVASAQDIAKKAGLKRTTTYSVLSYLVNRGVVAKTKVKNKTRFVAEPPEHLLNLVGELQANIQKALPELKAIYNTDVKPKITFYEGENAIQRVYDDTLAEQPAEILEWNTNAYFEQFPADHNYIDQRVKRGIRCRRIARQGSEWDTRHKARDSAELAETVIVPKTNFDPKIEVNIYNNKVAFMNYADQMSVIIESQAIADAMRQAYELSWKGAKATPL
jgi:sugar-specific transcriptional regulator TrmB